MTLKSWLGVTHRRIYGSLKSTDQGVIPFAADGMGLLIYIHSELLKSSGGKVVVTVVQGINLKPYAISY